MNTVAGRKHTMKTIRGRKTGIDCVVELTDEGYTTQLSLKKSLRVVDHSPTGFQWGYRGSGPAQLAAAILNEITGDPELARQYYQFFKSDHVSHWGNDFEINEFQVRDWLRSVGAVQASVIDKAKKEFNAFQQLYEKADYVWGVAIKSGRPPQRSLKFYEVAIPLSNNWVQKYKPYIEDLSPIASGLMNEVFEWKPLLEQIKNYWLPQFQTLIKSQQIEHPLSEGTDQIIAEIEELLENHIYPPKV